MSSNSKKLAHPFPTIAHEKGKSCYGGSQSLLPQKNEQNYGCGIIASANVISYLTRYHKCYDGLFDRISHFDSIPLSLFNNACMRLARGLLKPIPRFGINGLFLAWGLNSFFRRRHIPFRAKWCMKQSLMWNRMEQMLEDDLPVIFAVGPALPWKKAEVCFYKKLHDGTYKPSVRINAHFITATGLDAEWIRISSWGKKYYINRAEYEEYINNNSSPVVTNLLLLKKK